MADGVESRVLLLSTPLLYYYQSTSVHARQSTHTFCPTSCSKKPFVFVDMAAVRGVGSCNTSRSLVSVHSNDLRRMMVLLLLLDALLGGEGGVWAALNASWKTRRGRFEFGARNAGT